MNSSADTVILAFPRAIVPELSTLSRNLTDRMHTLLERNTEGALSTQEREELETLVQMAQFAQLVAIAAQGALGA